MYECIKQTSVIFVDAFDGVRRQYFGNIQIRIHIKCLVLMYIVKMYIITIVSVNTVVTFYTLRSPEYRRRPQLEVKYRISTSILRHFSMDYKAEGSVFFNMFRRILAPARRRLSNTSRRGITLHLQ
jgi:hypothetical protein